MANDPEFDEQAALDAVAEWSRTTGERLLRVVAPIYREGPRTPDPIGTGVLLRFGELIFLVSAAHVIEQVQSGPHYFGAAGHLLPLPGFRMTSTLEPGKSRDQDRVDLGYWILDPASASRLASADTLFPNVLELSPDEAPVGTNRYYLSGYPASRQPRSLKGRTWEVEDFGFITDELSAEAYAAAGIDRTTNLFVDFDKNDVFRAGAKITGPDLFGVSGGALWHVDGGKTANPHEPLLAGIVTTWRKSEPRGVIATRTQVLVKMMAKEFPQVGAALRKPRRRRTV